MNIQQGTLPVTLGDMLVVGSAPPKFMKALAVIADTLHQAYDNHPKIAPGKSKESCVLCSLTVREFLFRIGFKDAKVLPVVTIMEAVRDNEQIHSLGIGVPESPHKTEYGYWNGHMVVIVPSVNFLIDTTLYPVQRPQWPILPGMIAVAMPKDEAAVKPFGLQPLAGFHIGQDDGSDFALAWLDNPTNKGWRSGPDAIDRSRRVAVVEAMGRKFYPWMDD